MPRRWPASSLAQIVRPGVPVMYGGFTSNVDMRSGAPAFGTPEYTQAAQVTGQLARLIGVPFRSSNVTAANDVDAQAAYESAMSLWGAVMGGAQSCPACRRLARWRPHRLLREAHHRCRDAADDGGLFRAASRSIRAQPGAARRSARSARPGIIFGARAYDRSATRRAFYRAAACPTGTITTHGASAAR